MNEPDPLAEPPSEVVAFTTKVWEPAPNPVGVTVYMVAFFSAADWSPHDAGAPSNVQVRLAIAFA